ncbi:MAG TPA: S-adenosylmethionine:tRNA ribosyltransferase-isomerase [Streptosporangiaceae bacterium]|jgi:S-adenosylmethionine:tRNA ribosyltransferase-isomerase
MSSLALEEFTLPADLEAHDPPEARGLARDGVRLLVSRTATGEISHHRFRQLPGLLLPGDLLVVNTSQTLPAQVRVTTGLAVHFSTPRPDGSWLVELRQLKNKTSLPNAAGIPGQSLTLPGGAVLTLLDRETTRLWRATLSVAVVPYLLKHGVPIRYAYVPRDWPLTAYQTVFAQDPGSAEMPSASRPFSLSVVAQLVTRGVLIAPLTLHCGVSSLEGGEDPYPEPYAVPAATADLVNHVRARGGRVIAGGTTVVRALETAFGPDGRVAASAGLTSHVVTPQTGVRAVDGLLTGLHEPRSSHLRMLAAFAGPELLGRCYQAAIDERYLWHEFGDVHLLLP